MSAAQAVWSGSSSGGAQVKPAPSSVRDPVMPSSTSGRRHGRAVATSGVPAARASSQTAISFGFSRPIRKSAVRAGAQQVLLLRAAGVSAPLFYLIVSRSRSSLGCSGALVQADAAPACGELAAAVVCGTFGPSADDDAVQRPSRPRLHWRGWPLRRARFPPDTDCGRSGTTVLLRALSTHRYVVFLRLGAARASSCISFSARGTPSLRSLVRSISASSSMPDNSERLISQNQIRKTTTPARAP